MTATRKGASMRYVKGMERRMKEDKEAITDILSAIAQAQLALSEAERAFQDMVKSMQVGRMRGEWRSIHGLSEYYCSRCGEEFEIHAYDKEKYRFCPHCMAPMTDEAVDMVMERLEELHDTSN